MLPWHEIIVVLLIPLLINVQSIPTVTKERRESSRRAKQASATTTVDPGGVTDISTIDNSDGITTIASNLEAEKEPKESSAGWWMQTISDMDEQLLQIQAIVVKDEGAVKNCVAGNRKSEKRYFMCAGSILSRSHVLTSASCIHYATHIRHNVRAPLAVIVGPMKTELQIIRVVDYKIHQSHESDPYHKGFLTHNVAILKLGCRISVPNFHPVKLSTTPFTQLCDDTCKIALIRKVGKTSLIIYETQAYDIPVTKRKRRTIADSNTIVRKSRKIADPPIFDIIANSSSEIEEMITEAKTSSESEGSTDDSAFLDELHSIITDTANEEYDFSSSEKDSIKLTDTDSYELDRSLEQESSNKIISVRSSSGVNGCPETGTPVMIDDMQVALVTVPCDDRQPETSWRYTDISVNAEWIKGVMSDWDYTDKTSSAAPHGGGCQTCIYNFFIDYKGHNMTNRVETKESEGQKSKSMEQTDSQKNPVTRMVLESSNDDHSTSNHTVLKIESLKRFMSAPDNQLHRPNANNLPTTKDDISTKEMVGHNDHSYDNSFNNKLENGRHGIIDIQSEENIPNYGDSPYGDMSKASHFSNVFADDPRNYNQIHPTKIKFFKPSYQKFLIHKNRFQNNENITRDGNRDNVINDDDAELVLFNEYDSRKHSNENVDNGDLELNRKYYDKFKRFNNRYARLGNIHLYQDASKTYFNFDRDRFSAERKTKYMHHLISHNL